MVAQLGELRITAIDWTGQHALTVTVETTRSDMYLQLYAGRRLAGVSIGPGSGRVTGQVFPSSSPAPLTVILVPPADQQLDVGHLLPRLPWNQYRLNWSASDFPADAKWFEVAQASAPGEDVDFGESLGRVRYYPGLEQYGFDLQPFNETGEYEVGILPRDDAIPDGNPGTPATLLISATVYPPDVRIGDDGRRLQVGVANDELSVSFEYDW